MCLSKQLDPNFAIASPHGAVPQPTDPVPATLLRISSHTKHEVARFRAICSLQISGWGAEETTPLFTHIYQIPAFVEALLNPLCWSSVGCPLWLGRGTSYSKGGLSWALGSFLHPRKVRSLHCRPSGAGWRNSCQEGQKHSWSCLWAEAWIRWPRSTSWGYFPQFRVVCAICLFWSTEIYSGKKKVQYNQ